MTQLDEHQLAIVNATSQNIAAICGPGTGKSTVLIARYERINTPDAFLITFTNAGADVMRERIKAKGLAMPRFVGTLHALMLKLLKTTRPHLTILDEKQAEELARDCLAEIRSKVTVNGLRTAINAQRLTQAEQVAVMHYRAKLREYGAEDYDTLLQAGLAHLTEHPVKVKLLMVDEYQDSGYWDHLIYAAINADQRFIVGDIDQSIFGFRGSRPENLMEYAERPGTWTAFLERNYRSGKQICDAASSLIRHNRARLDKATISAVGFDAQISVARTQSEAEEAASVVMAVRASLEEGSVAVLCRYNSDRVRMANALRSAGVAVSEPERLDRPKDWPTALAMLAVGANPHNALTVRRYVTLRYGADYYSKERAASLASRTPIMFSADDKLLVAMENAQLSHASREQILELVKAVDNGQFSGWKDIAAEMLLYAMQTETAARRSNTAGVEVLTIHGSKGREFDRVILPCWDEGESNSFPGKETEADRRLAFVAITRARMEVLIVWSSKRANPYRPQVIEDRKPSRFIFELT